MGQAAKSFLIIELFIFATTVTMYFSAGRQWFPTLLMFLVMQFGALMGVVMGVRGRRKKTPEGDDLPLKPR